MPLPDVFERTASGAIHALSRVLAAGSELTAAPGAVRETLVREAGGILGAHAAALVALDRDERGIHVIAADPGPAPSYRLPISHPGLVVLREQLLEGGGVARAGGEEARSLGDLLGIAPAPGVLMMVPMRTRRERHVLVLAGPAGHSFGPEEEELATAFAHAAAVSISQLRLMAEHAEHAAKQAALARAAHELTRTLELEQVLGHICREAAGIVHGDFAWVALGEPAAGLIVRAEHGLAGAAAGVRLAPGADAADTRIELEPPEVLEGSAEALAAVRGYVAVPMAWSGAVHGVLCVGYRHRFDAHEADVRLLEAFAELAAAACANASTHEGLAHAARTDGLTGCLNHASFYEALRRELGRCGRTGETSSLVLLDLDGFKQVNEAHGHLVGDEVLRRVGEALRSAVRPYDLVARYGGDEFAIIVAGAGEAVAAEVAARAVARIAASTLDVAGEEIGATAGVAAWSEGMSHKELIDRADRALLIGKRSDPGTVIRAAEAGDGALAAAALPAPQQRSAAPRGRAPARDRLQHRARQLGLANALGARISAMTDAGEIVEAAAEELHSAFGYFLVALVRLRPDNYVECAAGRGDAFAFLTEPSWCQPREAGLIGRCLRERRPQLANDVQRDPDYDRTPETREVRSELCVPVWAGEELWGAINVEELRLHAFDEDDVRLLAMVADLVGSALRSALLYERLERAYLGTAEALAAALEAKDAYTAAHARSIVSWAERVGARLGLGPDELRDVRYGAAFHDIGKISVPEPVLNKRGPLDPDERHAIERHTIVGEQILAPVEFLAGVRPLVRHEHERWDGRGYPDGLAGEAIPLGSRIIFACDAYDAMTSERPYRPALSEEQARRELASNAGSQFDPRVVDALLAVLDEERDGLAQLGASAATSSTD